MEYNDIERVELWITKPKHILRAVAIALLIFVSFTGIPIFHKEAQARTVVTAPSPITSVNITDSGNTWAFGEWSASTGADFYEVRASESGYPSSNTSGTLVYWGTETSANFTGLSSNTTTYFRVFPIAYEDGLWAVNYHITDYSKAIKEASGWGSISEIYYNPSQDDGNSCLSKGAAELETYLEAMSGDNFTIVTDSPPEPPAIYLSVNATDPDISSLGLESFQIESDFEGINITGKDAFATRSGVYYLLDRILGVKWLSKHSNWWVVPDTLEDIGTFDIVREPDYIWREVAFGPNPLYGWDLDRTWKRRNLCGGPYAIRLSHSYYQFMPPEDWWDYEDSYLTEEATLSENINDSVTTIPVISTSGFPQETTDTPDPILLIDDEIIRYKSRNATNFLTCTRGYNGTTPESHNAGVAVYQIPGPGTTNCWQVKPDDAYVISQALTYAQGKIDTPIYFTFFSGENITTKVVSITPNDGQYWAEYGDKTTQQLTDLVYGLTDNVSANLSVANPGWYFGVYNYSLYADIPTFDFTYNGTVYVEVATAYDYTTLTDLERIEGILAAGGVVGIREYLDIFPWYWDTPPTWGTTRLDRITSLWDDGGTIYRSEGGHSWGSCGAIFWISARMAWDTTETVDDLLDEYCTYAYGAAKTPMVRYHQRLMEGQHISENFLAGAVTDLNSAMTLASGDEDVLERLRSHIYYIYWMWLYYTEYYDAIDELDLETFTELYTWCSHLRDLYILSYSYYEEDVFHDPLRDDWEWEEEDIQEWLEDNADYTIPTSSNASTWLAEMVTAYSGVTPIFARYVNPEKVELEALGDTETGQLAPLEARSSEIIVKATANDTIECELKTFSPTSNSTFTLYNLTDKALDSVELEGSPSWQSVNFTASDGTGLYKISGGGGIYTTSHPAGITAGPLKNGSTYIFVPSGTDTLLIEFSDFWDAAYLYDPESNLVDSLTSPSDYTVIGVSNPDEGLYKLTLDNDSGYNGVFKIFGVPDLVWGNPEKILKETS